MSSLPAELRELFFEDARRHLGGAARELARPVPDASTLGELRRHAHSLKGLGAAVGLDSLRDVAARLEALAAAARRRPRAFAARRGLVAEALRALEQMVDALERDETLRLAGADRLLRRLDEARQSLAR